MQNVQYTFSALKVPCQWQFDLRTSYYSLLLHFPRTLCYFDFYDGDGGDGLDCDRLCVSDL